jgi:hypothetical protein
LCLIAIVGITAAGEKLPIWILGRGNAKSDIGPMKGRRDRCGEEN